MDISFSVHEDSFSMKARGIFLHEGKLLVMHDIEENWYLVGGRVGWGETATQALEREITEEMGITVKASRLLWFHENTYEKRKAARQELTFYYLVDFSDSNLISKGEEFSFNEDGIVHEFRWVTPEELETLPFFSPFIKENISHIPDTPIMSCSKSIDIESNQNLTFNFDDGNKWFNVRVAAVYIHDGKMLAMHDGKAPFYYLPGGRLHFGESVLDALKREVSEEINTEARIVRPLWICQSLYDSDNHPGEITHELCFYFLLKADEELLSRGHGFIVDEEQRDIFQWLPIDSLPKQYLMPEFIKAGVERQPETLEMICEFTASIPKEEEEEIPKSKTYADIKGKRCTIDSLSLRHLVIHNKRIRELIIHGQVIYLDKFLCINEKRYVDFDVETNRHILKQKAYDNPQNCFFEFYIRDDEEEMPLYDGDFAFITDSEQARTYLKCPQSKRNLRLEERIHKYQRNIKEYGLLDELLYGKSVRDSIASLMRYRNIDPVRMDKLCMFEDNLTEHLIEKEKDFEVWQIVAILVSLRIPSRIAFKVMAKWRNIFDDDKALYSIIGTIFTQEVDVSEWYEVYGRYMERPSEEVSSENK